MTIEDPNELNTARGLTIRYPANNKRGFNARDDKNTARKPSSVVLVSKVQRALPLWE